MRKVQKIDQKKKKNFYFAYSSVSKPSAHIRKAIRPLPRSLSWREKSLCRSVILTGFFDCKYALFWGGSQISASEVGSKNRSKKFFFLYFVYSSVCEPSSLIRKTFRPIAGSLSWREKSLCRSVILTGYFDCKYALLRWIPDIRKWGRHKKIDQKKIFFLLFFFNRVRTSCSFS